MIALLRDMAKSSPSASVFSTLECPSGFAFKPNSTPFYTPIWPIRGDALETFEKFHLFEKFAPLLNCALNKFVSCLFICAFIFWHALHCCFLKLKPSAFFSDNKRRKVSNGGTCLKCLTCIAAGAAVAAVRFFTSYSTYPPHFAAPTAGHTCICQMQTAPKTECDRQQALPPRTPF